MYCRIHRTYHKGIRAKARCLLPELPKTAKEQKRIKDFRYQIDVMYAMEIASEHRTKYGNLLGAMI